jgi:hypothetical protein
MYAAAMQKTSKKAQGCCCNSKAQPLADDVCHVQQVVRWG